MKFAPEIQIELDDVYACPGNCAGCALSTSERRNIVADMSNETRKTIFTLLTPYINQLKELKKINLTYGIADHFLMDIDYLKNIYTDAYQFITQFDFVNDIKNKEISSIFLTLSLIGKEEIIIEKLKALHQLQYLNNNNKVRLLPIVVLDPNKLLHKSFGKTYENSIAIAKELFNEVDLTINLSIDSIEKMSAKELFNFANKYNFSDITINWVPTKDNLIYTYNENFNQILLNWLIDFYHIIDNKEININGLTCGYAPTIKKMLDAVKCSSDSQDLINAKPVLHIMNDLLNETLIKSIQFDHIGNFFPKFEAIGDISHNERFGFKHWGNINDVTNNNLYNYVENKISHTKQQIIKSLNNLHCQSCEFQSVCATSGFHVYNQILKNKKLNNELIYQCKHIGLGLFKKINQSAN